MSRRSFAVPILLGVASLNGLNDGWWQPPRRLRKCVRAAAQGVCTSMDTS